MPISTRDDSYRWYETWDFHILGTKYKDTEYMHRNTVKMIKSSAMFA